MSKKIFEIEHRDSRTKARTGVLTTAHGQVQTPVFMPVGTQGTVKTISNDELLGAGAQIILSNSYHLYLRPGESVMKDAGGLHALMNWKKPILTDSGGFQIFSLAKLNKITPEGVTFQSHVDGSKHFLSPEDVIRIEHNLGSDIIMPLDECVKYPSDHATVKKSLEITHDWARRSKVAWENQGCKNFYDRESILFGIVQGGVYHDLRQESAKALVDMDFPGYSIGGLSVGEPSQAMYETLAATLPHLPEEKPHYLMGVGLPLDLFEAVSQGVDMFDCVVPTRNGRNATVFTRYGKLLLRGASYTRDLGPIEEGCPCYTCKNHSRAYLRHLFNAEEYLAGRLASLHNLTFFIQLLRSMRRSIEENRFVEFRREFERDFKKEES